MPALGTVAIDNKNQSSAKQIKFLLTPKAYKNSSEIEAVNKSSVTIISNKRPKINLDIQNQDAPIGLIWDSQDHSCAYDALFTILGDIWVFNPTMWTHEFGLMSSFANKLGLGFQQVSLKQKYFEDARNSVRKLLHIKNSVALPNGTTGVDMSDLLVYMFTGRSVGQIKYKCTECGTASTSATKVTSMFTISQKHHWMTKQSTYLNSAQKCDQNDV